MHGGGVTTNRPPPTIQPRTERGDMGPSLPHTRNFVSPAPVQAPVQPRAEIIRREDVLEAQRALLATYSAQQARLLQDVQDDVRGGGYVSSADLAAERRRTSAMYLALYGACAGGAMGGLTLLGMAAAGWQPIVAIASWLAGTALATIAMAWRRHGQELEHSPEGIARHLLDWHGEIAMLEAETRRDLLEREHELALLDRRAAADAAAAQRQLAIDLAATQSAARRPAPVRMQVAPEPIQAPQAPQATQATQATQHTPTDAALPLDPPTASGGHAGGHAGWHAALMAWASTLHDGGLTTDGIVLARVPWSARSPWPADDKAQALRVCTRARPTLFEPAAGGRWRLRQEIASTSEQLLALLAQRGS